jgi:hypothetical protein
MLSVIVELHQSYFFDSENQFGKINLRWKHLISELKGDYKSQ